jgi:hypothetical protein
MTKNFSTLLKKQSWVLKIVNNFEEIERIFRVLVPFFLSLNHEKKVFSRIKAKGKIGKWSAPFQNLIS